jgi:hypothetical protein
MGDKTYTVNDKILKNLFALFSKMKKDEQDNKIKEEDKIAGGDKKKLMI